MNWIINHKRTLSVISLVLFIPGLIAAVTGMNIQGTLGTILQVAGNIGFLLGLVLIGLLYFAKKREEK